MSFMATIPSYSTLVTTGIKSQYKQAQAYYEKQKDAFIKHANQSFQQKAQKKGFGKTVGDAVEATIFNQVASKGENQLSKSAQGLLEEIEKTVQDFYSSKKDLSQLKAELLKIEKSGTTHTREGKKRSKADMKRLLYERLKSHYDSLFNASALEKIEKIVSSRIKDASVEKDILAQANSYATRYLYELSQQGFDNPQQITNAIDKDAYLRTLGGYFLEEIEAEAIQKLLKKTNLKIKGAGSAKVKSSSNKNAKVDSEIDIMITQLNTLEEAFNETEKTKQVLLSFTNEGQELVNELIQNITSWGIQAKAWDLKQYRYQYSIGSRADLLKEYEGARGRMSRKNGGTLQSMWFLSKYRNILLSLGAHNVLFRTGSTRLWTSEFIEAFRNKNYALAFNSKDNKLTSSVILTKVYNPSIFIE